MEEPSHLLYLKTTEELELIQSSFAQESQMLSWSPAFAAVAAEGSTAWELDLLREPWVWIGIPD